jgi:hypothetical protein
MKPTIAVASLSAMFVAACPSQEISVSHRVPHSVSQSQTPASGVGDVARATIAAGGTLEFKQLKIAVLAPTVDSGGGTSHDVASIRLEEGGVTQARTVRQGVSLNWHGYHVAIIAVHAPVEPGGERVELEVATVASLPQCIGKLIGKDQPWPCR